MPDLHAPFDGVTPIIVAAIGAFVARPEVRALTHRGLRRTRAAT